MQTNRIELAGYLAAKPDRFTIAALAEPSATVREALGARYGIGGLHATIHVLAPDGTPVWGAILSRGPFSQSRTGADGRHTWMSAASAVTPSVRR